jgi:putative colanic acid biosynthesis glycosyltransferase WcaI
MKFLILSQYYPPEIGASQVRLSAFCSQLVSAGHDVEVVTAMPHHPTGRIFPPYRRHFYLHEFRNGVSIRRVWAYPGNRSSIERILSYCSFAFTCLYGLLRAGRPDYLFVDSPPLLLGLAGWIASKWHRVPLVFNVADLWPDSAQALGLIGDGAVLRIGYWLERWIYRHSDYVTAVTEGIREVLTQSKGVPSAKILFLPNGADTVLFCPRPTDETLKRALGLAAKRIVLYAGNHGYAGAVDQILFAADRLRDDASVHFLLLGDGPEKRGLQMMAASLHLPNITFHDPVAIEDLPAFISLCDVAVVTLRKSNITRGARPAKTFAMMAAGKPIVLAGEGEAERLLHKANAGVVVPPEEPRALAAALQEVLKDRVALQTMGMNGRAFVTEHYEWGGLVRNWLAQLFSQSSAQMSRRLELKRG